MHPMSIRIARFVIVGLLGLLVSACASFQPAVTYDVSTYGALPDGKTVDTVPLQNALNACTTAGGGQVLIPSGRYVIGSVQMYSNTVIRLDPGAVLVGSPDVNDYPLMPVRFEGETVNGHCALIYAKMPTTSASSGAEPWRAIRAWEISAIRAGRAWSNSSAAAIFI